MSAATDRNLLFGVLAMKLGFVPRDGLVAAMDAWAASPDRSLGELLVERGELGEGERPLLEMAVDKHLAKHGDAGRSVVALGAQSDVRLVAESVKNSNLQSHFSTLDTTTAHAGDTRAGERIGQPSSAEGRFQILREHAHGGLGKVFVARDGELGRDVALKEIDPRYCEDEDIRARFVLEAEITGSLEHPGIVPVYGLGRHEDGRPFYAMRFIRGESLMDAIKAYHENGTSNRNVSSARLAMRRLLSVFVDVCNAVAYAHSRGVIHRDLKPENVMLGPYGETLLVDWGLAKLVDRDQPAPKDEPESQDAAAPLSTLRPAPVDGSHPTQLGTVIGTPPYMSPEQAAGLVDQLGPASDIYGLGAMLYALLTGRVPFQGKEAADILADVVAGRITPPRKTCPDVPKALEAICLKAMALDPDRRYDSAIDLAADIEGYLADEPVTAWKEPFRLRAARWMRRHRTLVTGAAAATVVAVAALSVSVALLTAANDRERAAAQLAQANELTAQRKTEEAAGNLKLARQAIEQYMTQVSEDPRLKVHNLDTLRRDLLKTAREFYEKLVQQEPDKPDLRADWAAAHVRLATITAETGSMPQAVKLAETAEAIYQDLRRKHPDNGAFLTGLAKTRVRLGMFYKMTGQEEDAKSQFKTAVAEADRLAEGGCQLPDVGAIRADARYQLARFAFQANQHDEAQALLKEAIDIRQRLVEAEPEETMHKSHSGEDYRLLGVSYQSCERYEEAMAAITKAADIHGELVAADRVMPRHLSDLALACECLAMLGDKMSKAGGANDSAAWDPTSVPDAFRKALAIRKTLADEHPEVWQYEHELARSHMLLALHHYRQSKLPESEKDFDAANKIFARLAEQHPRIPLLRSSLGSTLWHLAYIARCDGRNDEAIATMQKAADTHRELAADFREEPKYEQWSAALHFHLANWHAEDNRTDKAQAAYEQAQRAARNLVRNHPKVAKYRVELARVCLALGNLAWGRNEPDAAIDLYGQVVDAIQKPPSAIDAHAPARQITVTAHWNIAKAHLHARQYPQAFANWEQARKLDAESEQQANRLLLGFWGIMLLARMGENDRARQVVNEMADTTNADGNYLLTLAIMCGNHCVSASKDASLKPEERAAVVDQLAEAVLVFLQRAKATGLFDDPAKAKMARQMAALPPFIDRQEIQQFVKGLPEEEP